MLGYGGYGNRREFIGGVALASLIPVLAAGVARPFIPILASVPDRTAGVAGLLILACLLFAVGLAVIWGLTALFTRRARDMGWPAWIGAAGFFAFNAAAALSNLPLLAFVWLLLLAAWPGGSSRRHSAEAEFA